MNPDSFAWWTDSFKIDGYDYGRISIGLSGRNKYLPEGETKPLWKGKSYGLKYSTDE